MLFNKQNRQREHVLFGVVRWNLDAQLHWLDTLHSLQKYADRFILSPMNHAEPNGAFELLFMCLDAYISLSLFDIFFFLREI